jgi:Uncharacterized protein with protein kinase and helix-hairpin-helix DNA-binding domains
MEFEKGRQIKVRDSENLITVIEKLGAGGQGTVYKVDYQGGEYALKWYFINSIKNPAAFKKNLIENIFDGSPDKCFLWPILLTEDVEDSFGYLMNLRPPEYKSFTDFLNARVRFRSHTARVNAALTIVDGFVSLHHQGKSYQDLNDGNFFINPDTGDVLICDNDNVAPYSVNLGIAGKMRYMAPEVVLGEKPGMESDYFSLGILLFLLLFHAHPFEGEDVIKSVCLTDESEKKHYGSSPVFIYDPADASNRPVRGVHNNAIKFWPLYPDFIRNAFVTSFTQGIREKAKRVSDTEWRKYFLRLRDEIITCPCGCENFSCANEIPGTNSIRCLGCNEQIIKPLRLNVQKLSLALYPGNKLYECHTAGLGSDYRKVTGEVAKNKNNPALWGIRNLSGATWYAVMPDGTSKSVAPNSVVPIFRNIKIDFGANNKAEIL